MSDSSFFSQSGSNEATATTINTKVNEAEAAKAAAEAAQAAAEAARDLANASAADAQSSEDDAETAQAASEAARDASVSSASAAAASATSANSYSDDARKLAIEAEDTQYLLSDGTTGYSALHYHEKASDSASAAAVSAGAASIDAGTASQDAATATTKAGEASASAAAALQSEQNASQSETNSSQSEANSSQSETNAGQSETNAAASALTATTQAGIATTQAGISTTQAGTATTKAGEASNSASSALSAQSAAEAARDSALSALDSFDDRYLGVKSSAPTVDNDGDTLQQGALYYSSTDTAMKVYDGSQWLNAYASLSGALLATNNLNDLNNAATARTNLGLAALASSGAYSDLTGTPTTIAGYGITDAFDGAFSSLTGKPTTVSGYGITDVPDDLLDLGITDGTNGQALKTDGAGNFSFGDVATSTAWADITGKPTTISGFGITDAFDGAFSSLSGKPTTISGYGITDAFDGAYSSLTGAPSLATVATSGAYSDLSGTPSLSAVATSGNYSDLIGTPTIPTNNNQLSNGAGYITSADGGNAATLDGIDSTSFLRSDTADTMTGDLTLTNKLIFGTNNELSISSNGTTINAELDHPAEFNLFTNGGDAQFNIDANVAGGAGLQLNCTTTGGYQRINAAQTAVPFQLQYGGTTKLSIDSNGVDTFGTLVNDGHLLVVNNGVSNQGDNNTHFNYQDTGVNYIRGTLTYSSSPFRIASGGIQRSAHNNGHLEGGYNNIGANGLNTNPIYTIGGNYNPSSTTLSNMYGIGYCRGDASFIPQTSSAHWGQYVAADGDARIFLNGSTGDGLFSGNVTAYASDERLKENIETIPNALDKVCQLRGVTFDWKDDCEDKGFMPTMKHETGVLAQNVASIIPDAVTPAPFDSNYLTVDKEKIIPVLIEAIKELKAEIEELKKG